MTRRVLTAAILLALVLCGCVNPTTERVFAFIDEHGFPSIYDLGTRRVIWRAERPAPAQVGPTWSPDGSLLAYGAFDSVSGVAYIGCLNTDSMECRYLPVSPELFLIGISWCWSASGSYLLARAPGVPALDATLINIRSMGVVKSFPMNGEPLWSPDEKSLSYDVVSGSEGGVARQRNLVVLDLQTGDSTVLLNGEPGIRLTAVAWTEDGAVVYVSESDSERHVRDTKGREYDSAAYLTIPTDAERPPELFYKDMVTVTASDKNVAGEWLVSGAKSRARLGHPRSDIWHENRTGSQRRLCSVETSHRKMRLQWA